LCPQKKSKTPQCTTLPKKSKLAAPLRGAFWRNRQYNHMSAKHQKTTPKATKTALSRQKIFYHNNQYFTN
jgi:hypothetical protein